MRIDLKVMAIAVAMMIALTGCGGGGSSDSNAPSNSNKPSSSDTTTETPENKEDDKTTETTPEGVTIVKPVKVEENVAKAENGAYRISFNQEKGDVVGTESDYQIRATIYQYDRYKVADLKNLKKGDQLCYHDCSTAAWKVITIETVEFYQDEAMINGGIEAGHGGIGLILKDNLYVHSDMDHSIDCYKIGTKTLPVTEDVVMTDDDYSFTGASGTVTHNGASAVYKVITGPARVKGKDGIVRTNRYVSSNTTVTLKNGKIIKIHRDPLA